MLPDLAFIDWHPRGLQDIDIAGPADPAQAGWFSPQPLASNPALSRGPNKVVLWSYPIIRNGLIYVSDIRNGLYILRYTGPHAAEAAAIGFLEGNSNLGDTPAWPAPAAAERPGSRGPGGVDARACQVPERDTPARPFWIMIPNGSRRRAPDPPRARPRRVSGRRRGPCRASSAPSSRCRRWRRTGSRGCGPGGHQHDGDDQHRDAAGDHHPAVPAMPAVFFLRRDIPAGTPRRACRAQVPGVAADSGDRCCVTMCLPCCALTAPSRCRAQGSRQRPKVPARPAQGPYPIREGGMTCWGY